MKLHFHIILLFSFLFSIVEAKSFTYWDVHQMPKSIEKDYYIWRLLSQKKTTKQEAHNIIHEASRLNKKLRVAYRKKTGSNATLPKINVTGPINNNWRARSKANKHFKHGVKGIFTDFLQH